MKKKIHVSLRDEMFYVGFMLPIAVVDHFDRVASKQLRTRSDVLRTALIDTLTAQGVVATGDEAEAGK